MRKVSLITTCKGRLHHLKKAMPFFLDQGVMSLLYDVIVVDYGCPSGTFEWCRKHTDPKVKCVAVRRNVAEFNLNRARNIGAKLSNADAFLFIDCDILLSPSTVIDALSVLNGHDFAMLCVEQSNPVGNGSFYIHQPRADYGPGVSVIGRIYTRDAFESLRGYDESFRGWGWDDVDLTVRARAANMKVASLPVSAVFLNHSAEESVRFYAEKDKAVSAEQNRKILDDAGRLVNPNGWGRAGDDMRIHSQTADWRNPNFIDLAKNSDREGRGDTQGGWHEFVAHMCRNRKILDMGSGMGHSKARMETSGCTVSRYEPASGLPSDAAPPFPDKSYDIVTAFDVLEHVVNDFGFIRDMARIAEDMIFLSTPNIRASRCENWFHVREYTPRQLRDLVRRATGNEPMLMVSDARDGSTWRFLDEPAFDESDSPTLGILCSVQ